MIQEAHSDFINVMKDTLFCPTFMAFYSKQFGIYNGLKFNISVLKIVDQYDRDSRCFEIRGERIQLMIENVVLTFGLPIEGDGFIMNKICTLKDRGVIKYYFRNVKKIIKISIEDAFDDFLVKQRRRTELDLIEDEQLEQQVTLNKVIKDRKRLATQDFTTLIILFISTTLFFSSSKYTIPWYLVEQIANIQLMKNICRLKLSGSSSLNHSRISNRIHF